MGKLLLGRGLFWGRLVGPVFQRHLYPGGSASHYRLNLLAWGTLFLVPGLRFNIGILSVGMLRPKSQPKSQIGCLRTGTEARTRFQYLTGYFISYPRITTCSMPSGPQPTTLYGQVDHCNMSQGTRPHNHYYILAQWTTTSITKIKMAIGPHPVCSRNHIPTLFLAERRSWYKTIFKIPTRGFRGGGSRG